MNYLITGGAGFIGSHLADALVERGDRVVALDDVSTGNIDNVAHLLDNPKFSLREGTVLNHPLVAQLAGRADVVVHLAAAVGVKLIVEQPLTSLITNIRGTEIVLDAASMGDCRVMVASTSEIYGKNSFGPLVENADRILGSPFVARWSYSEAKAVDEILAHAYWREKGTEAIVVRFFNCVGPRQTGTYGMVVPSLVRQALDGADITVFGTGEQLRCFSHVLDTVEATVRLLDHPDSPGDPFNVGRAERVLHQRARGADRGQDGLGLQDRAHPLRGGVRGGLRGHGATRARHHADPQPHRVGAHAHARRHPRRRDRVRARARPALDAKQPPARAKGSRRGRAQIEMNEGTLEPGGSASASTLPAASTRLATALPRRSACSFESMIDAAVREDLEEPLLRGARIAQQRGLGDVERARQPRERLDRRLHMTVLVP